MSTNPRCPVCGMTVNPDSPGATELHEGQLFAFCSEDCRAAFLAKPGAYAGPDRD